MIVHPECHVGYVTLTRENAKNIIWAPLKDIARSHGIRLKFNKSTGDVECENGSKMRVFGAAHEDEMEKMRGDKYPIVVIDEAQGIGPHMVPMIQDVIEPSLLDYGAEAQLVVTGTPNAACAGTFFDLTHNRGSLKGFSTHNWTLLENPHLPDPEGWLKNKMERSGWDDNHPTYLREYRGIWVRDTNGQVYQLKDKINVIHELPLDLDEYEFCLGIDLGFRDPSAFCVAAYSEEKKEVVIVESFKESELHPAEVVVIAEKYCQQYNISSIVADPGGGMSRALIEEMRAKHALPAKPAEKRKKADHIAMLNGDLASGSIKIYSAANKELLSEMRLLQWDDRSMMTGKLKEDRRTPNHLCDAFLYSWRDCRHHGDSWEENLPKVGTPDWYKAYEEELERNAELETFGDPDNPWWAKIV